MAAAKTLDRGALTGELLCSLHETLALFDLAPAVLKRSYAPGKWTARELLLHIADTEAVLLERLKRIAGEEEPVLLAFDQDRWTEKLNYKQRDLNLARLQFEAARRGVIELLKLTPKQLDKRTGLHTEAGFQSFAQVAAKVQAHTAHHLEQLRAIAAGKRWTPKAPKK
jgi:hypothetical protein